MPAAGLATAARQCVYTLTSADPARAGTHNIARYLPLHAARQPGKLAVVFPAGIGQFRAMLLTAQITTS